VRVGAPDPSLTGVSGMAAATELCEQLDVVGALDAAVGPIKQRARGQSAGRLLVGMAATQLAGQDHLVGLDHLGLPGRDGLAGWVGALTLCGLRCAAACPPVGSATCWRERHAWSSRGRSTSCTMSRVAAAIGMATSAPMTP
jgi:hypothetical protein